jgi:hypothetical protein
MTTPSQGFRPIRPSATTPSSLSGDGVRLADMSMPTIYSCAAIEPASRKVKPQHARDQQVVLLEHVVRFIKVKGRSSRTAPMEATDNKWSSASRQRERHYVYRVFIDATRAGYQEFGIMRDPTGSIGQCARSQYWYDLSAGS